jgi:hypothetical protein
MPDAETALLAELARRYVWWPPIGDTPHPPERVIAQAMDLGTYDDIRRLEQTFGHERLAQVMLHATPGWFSARSWEFWRGRLTAVLGRPLPQHPPRRTFDAAPVETPPRATPSPISQTCR